MGDDAQRLGAPRGPRQRVDQRGGVVAVHVDDLPAESAELVGERLDVVGLGDARALLQRVAIDDQSQIGELVVPGGHRRLPIAALLQFAVAGDDEDAKVRLVDLPGDGDADGDRQAVAERAGVGLDAGDIVAVGMAVEHRHRLHVGREPIERDEAGFSERRIERAARMALAEDQPVAAGVARRLRVDAQHAEIQRRQDVGDRQVAAGMALSRAA